MRGFVTGVAIALAGLPAVASAQLPGAGYTFDRQWNCGLFYGNQACWFNGVLGYNSAYDHSWGWASADYYASCNDQDSRQMGVDVAHPYDSERHTIYGHAEA